MSTTGSNLDQAVQVLELRRDGDTYAWEKARRTWAAAEQDARKNLFSSVGIGAHGVTFTIRKSRPLTLHNAFRWRGRFCFLTSIVDGDPGFQVVKAALCDPLDCIKDADRAPQGCRFPGVLTEKYVGHEQLDPHAEVTGDLVLVTPKAVALVPGSWVIAEDRYFLVRVPHELDPFKNEYEIRRREDC
ncbi:hypothetical protein [uncultured Oscillibacter sp.]|uniref:hypothetical protein n=1 Tax=uncultured Oscillibacter sp. TaxID=876091 RepID=UPI002601B618|nr:hypothetical protein [uncultured Oscillibacter sp.]